MSLRTTLPAVRQVSDTVAVIGGGPSLRDFDLGVIPEDWSIITVNNSYKLIAKPDVVFFADARWYKVHREELQHRFRGRMVTTFAEFQNVPLEEVPRIARDYKADLGVKDPRPDPTRNPSGLALAGRDSGTMAVNLAYLLGAKNIVLFGFDMQFDGERSHWHGGHIWPTTEARYQNQFAPILVRMCRELSSRSVRVWRATQPGPSDIPYREVSDIVDDIKSGIDAV